MLLIRNFLSEDQQLAVVDKCRKVVKVFPLMTFTVNNFNYKMQSTSCGQYAWISDNKGYRYLKNQPNGKPLPPIPQLIESLAIQASKLVNCHDFKPETCLINYYKNNGKLGLHRDNSEKNLTAPIISFSLGDSAIFLVEINNKIEEITLSSGDLLILHDETRLARHGIKRIISNSSNLLRNGGRLNLTIRQVI